KDVFGRELGEAELQPVYRGETEVPLIVAKTYRTPYTTPLRGQLLREIPVFKVKKDTLVGSPLKYGPRDKTAKQYQVRLQAGSSYVIDMRITKVDSCLVLKGPNDEEVARDDDSGGELNARIRYLCPAQGDYSIWATTFDGSEGEFELTMLEIRPIEAAGE